MNVGDAPPRPALRTLELRLLGGFELRVDDDPVELSESSQRLVGFLALRGRGRPRSCVAGELWPEKSDERAMANLRSAIWRLPRSIGFELVALTPTLVALAPSVVLDTAEAERRLSVIRTATVDQIYADVRRSVGLELLPGWYDDWVLHERERLREIQFHVLELSTERLCAAGWYGEAIDAAHRLVAADLYRERSHLLLIRTLAQEGSLLSASRAFERFVDVMEGDLHVSVTIDLATALQFRADAPVLVSSGGAPARRS